MICLHFVCKVPSLGRQDDTPAVGPEIVHGLDGRCTTDTTVKSSALTVFRLLLG